jgi:hypothetical protein
MEQQPSLEPQEADQTVSRRLRVAVFIKKLGLLLVVSTGAAVAYALVLGHQTMRGFSDGLFLVGALLLSVGFLPMVGDAFGRSSVSSRRKDKTLEDVMEEQRKRIKKDNSLAYLLGAGGVIIVASSLLVGFAWG